MIQRVIYISRAAKDLTKFDLKELLYSARIKNKEMQITGFLMHHSKYFIQYLEGSEKPIADLIACIRADKRHYDFNIIYCDTSDEKQFSNWDMLFHTEEDSILGSEIEQLFSHVDIEQLRKLIKSVSLNRLII